MDAGRPARQIETATSFKLIREKANASYGIWLTGGSTIRDFIAAE